MKKLLFICTGNYYRSRYAEYLFNHLASQAQLDWISFSRGTEADQCRNEGPLSIHTQKALSLKALPIPQPLPYPVQLKAPDLQQANLIVALKQAEHQPYIQLHYPHFDNKIIYWQVHDVEIDHPDKALAEVDQLVNDLVKTLKMSV